MKKNIVRGAALFPVIAGVLIFIGGAAVGAGAMYLYGRMHGGGLGDSMEVSLDIDEPTEAMEEITSESETEIPPTTEEMTIPTTEPLTEAVTEAFYAVTITIEGNAYYYQENPIEPDELLTILHYMNDDALTVRIIKQNASRNASIRLKNLLENEGIPYTEQSESIEMTEPTETFISRETTIPVQTFRPRETTATAIETIRPRETTTTTETTYWAFP